MLPLATCPSGELRMVSFRLVLGSPPLFSQPLRAWDSALSLDDRQGLVPDGACTVHLDTGRMRSIKIRDTRFHSPCFWVMFLLLLPRCSWNTSPDGWLELTSFELCDCASDLFQMVRLFCRMGMGLEILSVGQR